MGELNSLVPEAKAAGITAWKARFLIRQGLVEAWRFGNCLAVKKGAFDQFRHDRRRKQPA